MSTCDGPLTQLAHWAKADAPSERDDVRLRASLLGVLRTLSAGGYRYIKDREAVAKDAWKTWLGDGSGIGYDLSKFTDHYPRVGIAASGGARGLERHRPETN